MRSKADTKPGAAKWQQVAPVLKSSPRERKWGSPATLDKDVLGGALWVLKTNARLTGFAATISAVPNQLSGPSAVRLQRDTGWFVTKRSR